MYVHGIYHQNVMFYGLYDLLVPIDGILKIRKVLVRYTIYYLFLFRKKISISLLVNMQSVYSREDSSVGKEVVKGGIFVN